MTLFWWGLCLDNSPLSKFVSLPVLPAPTSLPPPLLSSYFINGSSWRSFSGIQGLLSFGVLMSCDAWNTAKTLLETVAIQAGARGPIRGPDGRAQAVVPQDAQSPADPRSRESVGPRAEPGKRPVNNEFLCSQFFPRFLIPLDSCSLELLDLRLWPASVPTTQVTWSRAYQNPHGGEPPPPPHRGDTKMVRCWPHLLGPLRCSLRSWAYRQVQSALVLVEKCVAAFNSFWKPPSRFLIYMYYI